MRLESAHSVSDVTKSRSSACFCDGFMENPGNGNGEFLRANRDGPNGTRSVVRMLHAISAASMGSGTDEELEAAGRELVVELRDANEPPEQVVLLIKRILAQAGVRPTHTQADSSMLPVERHALIYRSVIESSIRHYFQRPALEGGGTN